MAIKRRLLTSLMMTCLAIGLCAVPAVAFAATMAQDGLTVTVSTDKTSYRADDVVLVKTTVTNNNAAAVTNIKLEHLLPAGLKLTTGSQTIAIASLAAGASQTVTVTALVETNTPTNDPADGDNLPQTNDEPFAFALVALLLVLGCVLLATSRLHDKSSRLNRQQMGRTLSVLIGVVLVGGIAFIVPASWQAYADPASSQKTFTVEEHFTYGGVDNICTVKISYDEVTNPPVDPTPVPPTANQTTPQFANHTDIDKVYGNPYFSLPTVTGGESSGAYSYRSSDETVATVDASGGVTILRAGTTVLYVKKLGDAHYFDSAEDSITVQVAKAAGAAVSGAPTVSGTPTTTSITVNSVSNAGGTGQAVHYAISTSSSTVPASGWQSATSFDSLTPATTYYVYARTASNDNYNAGTALVSQGIDTASTCSFTAPLPITANGVTATVSFDKASPQAVGTSVTAIVTLSGTAIASGDFSIDLTSASAGLVSNPKTRLVPLGAVQNDTYNFGFTVPTTDVSDFVLTFSFVANSHALTADTTPIGYWLSAFNFDTSAHTGDDPYLGEVRLFADNFAMRDYETSNGQLLSLSQNTALFSLLGTSYGGNGINTFGLPNINGSGSGLLLPPLLSPVSTGTLHYDIVISGVFPYRESNSPTRITVNLGLDSATGELEVMREPLYYQPLAYLGTGRYLSEVLLLNSTANPGSGFVECDGRTLSISQNTALFSLLGTSYGGDGQSTFALPNLTDQSPINGYTYYIVTQGLYPSRS